MDLNPLSPLSGPLVISLKGILLPEIMINILFPIGHLTEPPF